MVNATAAISRSSIFLLLAKPNVQQLEIVFSSIFLYNFSNTILSVRRTICVQDLK